MAKVYIKTDDQERITGINSDFFLGADPLDWVLIDEGEGDKYTHAQGHYLPGGLIDDNGLLRWRLDDEGKPTLRDAAELEAELEAQPAPVDVMADLRAEVATLAELNRGLTSLMTALARMMPMPQGEETKENGKEENDL